MRLEGKVALVSGGARGMGAVESKLFAKEGAKVILCDVLEEEGRQVEAEVAEAGGEAMFVKVDVTREEDWADAVEKGVARFGKLNVLVNNAGVSGRGYPDPTSLEGWDHVMEVNSKGVFLGTRSVIPKMQDAGGGSIINISSIMGIVGSDSGHPAYHASKGAVRLFTKAIAVRHGKDRIRVNSVHPGYMPPMPSGGVHTEAVRDAQIGAVPLGREGTYEDVANAVLFLASDEASYISGTELIVDGGYTAH